MKKLKKKEIVLIIIVILGIIFFNIKDFSFKMNQKLLIEESLDSEESKNADGENVESNKKGTEDSEKEVSKPADIKVDICGAVKKPGVIVLKEGDRILDAINKAGGLTDKADILRINRSKYVYDSEKIIIPEIGENINIETINESNNIGIDEKININTASKEELIKLDGIGESISQRIIKYRETNKGFEDINEIMKVSGIGESKFNQIKDSIKVK